MQFFNCIIQSILQFISLETKISMSKSLEFSDFKFQFWQNLLQPEATLDTLWSALELSMACAGQRKASFQGQYRQRAKKHAQNCMFLGLCVLRARNQRKTRICNIQSLLKNQMSNTVLEFRLCTKLGDKVVIFSKERTNLLIQSSQSVTI